jgi:hypothetical protein
MIVNGKIVPDWDKSKISTGYQRPAQFKMVTWDMGRLQGWLLGQNKLKRSFFERIIR